MEDSSCEEPNNISKNEPEVIIKTEINETIDYTNTPPLTIKQHRIAQLSPSAIPATILQQPLISIPVTASIIQNNPPSPDLLSTGQKHCKTCDIKFNHLRSFIAHKQYYCKSRLAEHDPSVSPTQPNVVGRATEASVL